MSDSLPEAVFHIYPTDCDMLGHMNHASMLELMERARWALMDHRVRIEDVVRETVFPVVRHVDIGYRAKTLPGDDLAITSGILKVGTTSYTVRHEARKVATGELVAEAQLVLVAIDRAGRPVPVPAVWTAAMPPWPQRA